MGAQLVREPRATNIPLKRSIMKSLTILLLALPYLVFASKTDDDDFKRLARSNFNDMFTRALRSPQQNEMFMRSLKSYPEMNEMFSRALRGDDMWMRALKRGGYGGSKDMFMRALRSPSDMFMRALRSDDMWMRSLKKRSGEDMWMRAL